MRVLRLLALSSFFAAIFVACSLDWSARGVERDEAGTPPPFFLDAPAGDANGSDGGDAGEGGVDCAMLEAQLADARRNARTNCILGSQTDCRTTGVEDECGCTVAVINDAGTPNTDTYASLAAQVRASCKPACDAGPCNTPPMNSWACLQPGTPTPTCYP